MTEHEAAHEAEAPETPPEAQNEAQDAPEGETAGDKGQLSREAAKYRAQLRETEAERDALTERVTELRTHSAEIALGDHMRDPAALWKFGYTVDDVCDPETGYPDAAKISDAANTVQTAVQGAPRRPKPDPNQGRGGSALPRPRRMEDALM